MIQNNAKLENEIKEIFPRMDGSYDRPLREEHTSLRDSEKVAELTATTWDGEEATWEVITFETAGAMQRGHGWSKWAIRFNKKW